MALATEPFQASHKKQGSAPVTEVPISIRPRAWTGAVFWFAFEKRLWLKFHDRMNDRRNT